MSVYRTDSKSLVLGPSGTVPFALIGVSSSLNRESSMKSLRIVTNQSFCWFDHKRVTPSSNLVGASMIGNTEGYCLGVGVTGSSKKCALSTGNGSCRGCSSCRGKMIDGKDFTFLMTRLIDMLCE